MAASATHGGARQRRASVDGRDAATFVVTVVAIALFVASGGAVIPAAVRSIGGFGEAVGGLAGSALLLNVALIVFGWRKWGELRAEIGERRAAEARAYELAYHDSLTGFLNRKSLADEAAALPRERRARLALMIIDLDRFKRVNDVHGHAAGDAVLVEVARRIGQAVPKDALCARLGGDEFALLLHGPDAERAAADAVAARIGDVLGAPLKADGITAHVGGSIGIATADGNTEPAIGPLLRRADIAMYEAKGAGGQRVAWFNDQMEVELQRRNAIESDMRAGIPLGQFVPYFEKQVDIATGKLHGFEVLARWLHPTQGIIEPADFIPLAESTGLISELSMSVMQQAFLEAKHWDPSTRLAVNISPVQLKDPMLGAHIVKLLAETGFPAQRLEIEITESSLFENMDLALSTIQSLKNQGISLSLDDFGTGYSSLAHLQALPFDRIKIDRSFVLAMNESSESAAIVNAIARLGDSLGLPVTAEGIESAAILEKLGPLGCADGQGWHYGKPEPAAEIRNLLKTMKMRVEDVVVPQIAPAAEPAVPTEAVPERRRGGRSRSSWIR